MFYDIEMTNKCNLRCKTCPNQFKYRKQGYMKPETLKLIADDLAAHVPLNERIVLHGLGEPLMSPYLWENLDYLQSKLFSRVDFSTNGNLFTKEVSDRIINYPMFENGFIKFSINSARKEIMEEINTGSNFEKVINNFKYLLAKNDEAGRPITVHSQLMVTKKNEDETIDELYKLIGRNDFHIVIKKINNVSRLVPDNDLTYNDNYRTDCMFTNESIFFHWDGDITCCCDDDTKTQVIGNIKDGFFSEKTQKRKGELEEAWRKKDWSKLPLCKKCLGL